MISETENMLIDNATAALAEGHKVEVARVGVAELIEIERIYVVGQTDAVAVIRKDAPPSEVLYWSAGQLAVLKVTDMTNPLAGFLNASAD